jgi:hypothetical protein
MMMSAATKMIVGLLLLAGTVRAEECPQPSPSPDRAVFSRLDTPEFRAQLRRGHSWRDSAGWVGEYYSRLELAAFLGEVDLVKELAPFAPYDVRVSAASFAIAEGHKDLVVLFLNERWVSPESSRDNAPLILVASATGHADVLREFIDRKADMYAKDGEVLFQAIMNHQQESVATLLSAGFDASRFRTPKGQTALELARKLQDPCIEKQLSN